MFFFELIDQITDLMIKRVQMSRKLDIAAYNLKPEVLSTRRRLSFNLNTQLLGIPYRHP